MLLSVIVPTYNSAPTLSVLLDSLKEQTLTDYEVIVVDDASTDETSDIVKRYPFRYERLPKNQGPATARNHAARLANGQWFVFTDADTVFHPDTLQRIADVLKKSDADALIGTYAGKPASKGFAPRFKALWEWYSHIMPYPIEEQELIEVTVWVPRPGVVRRSVFETLGGFNTIFSGADLEDLELGYRLVANGYTIFFVPSLRILHHYPESLLKELKTFYHRCSVWMRIFAKRRKFDCAGDGSLKQAVGHVVGFSSFVFALSSFVHPPLASAALLGALGYTLFHREFVVLALKEEGVGFTLRALPVALLHSVVLGFGAGYGLLTAFTNKR